MTRFLPRILDDSPTADFNEETERLFAYHQATKHSYYSIRSSAHYLDWNNQPNPFRSYEGAPVTMLAPEPGFPDIGTFEALGALERRTRPANEGDSEKSDAVQLDAIWLSQLLWHSMAVSAWKKVPRTGARYSLRVNPSSGNLHPTETYVAPSGFAGIEDGLYHYRADQHALELRSSGGWTQHLAQELPIPWAAESCLIVGFTSIFWREAWKYRDRAYRYCCHDLGHAMMSVLLSARALGLAGGAIGQFADLRLTRALGLTGSDEAPLAFLVFRSKSAGAQKSILPRKTFAGVPNELSPEEIPYELLLGVHRATILPDDWRPRQNGATANAATFDEGHAPPRELIRNPVRDSNLGGVARRRRSALDFDPRTPPMERGEVQQILDFATRDWAADWHANSGGEDTAGGAGTDFVTLYLYVHRVQDCEPGVYRWDTSDRNLVQLHRGYVERVAAYLSLEQALAGNACFAISMVADLAAAARSLGNRGYRYAHFEAGAIGQRLYLGAEALGWNATGIGAFYDDDVHRYLGFLEESDVGLPVRQAGVIGAVEAAEKTALVMLGSPTSRRAAAQAQDSAESASTVSGLHNGIAPGTDSSKLPRQVIYHFAIGRAVPDPRVET
jgi:SagB-type dehydrogenase family enzyme